MDLVTLKQFAESQGITYEAVRRQVIRYEEKLSGHIFKQNGVQYLDEDAVTFLKERRRSSPIVLQTMDQKEEIDQLKEQIETLRVQLMTVQNELVKSQEEHLKAKDRIIELQDEAKKTIEDRAKYTALLEDNKAKEAKLTEAKSRIEDLQKEHAEDQEQIEGLWKDRKEDQEALEKVLNLRDEDQRTIEDLRKKAEADREIIKGLQRQRDEAQTEAQSFKRSIFGFYRKR